MIDYEGLRCLVARARARGLIWLDADRREMNRLAFENERLAAERDYWKEQYFAAKSGSERQRNNELLIAIKERLEQRIKFNASTLSEEFNISTKTAHRYIETVREKFDLQFVWDTPRRTYRMEDAA